MLETFDFHGEPVDALDLKCLLVSAGMQYPPHVYEALKGSVRLSDPSNFFACNCVILPGEVAVHLNQNFDSAFSLDLDAHGAPGLYHQGQRIAPVSFPRPSAYYEQETSEGRSFGSMAVLEGDALLAFFYMWPCDYAKTNENCGFCFQVMADMAGFQLPSPSPQEVAEIVAYGMEHANVKEVQLTAGTKFVSKNECTQYTEILRAIDARIGLDNIPAEIYIYMTAQKDLGAVDEVFAAGADRIAHDLHVWDAALHARHAPGHARKITREVQLRALEYIANTHGPNKAFSAFVVGLEPLESLLEGATWCAERGIVPAFSVWMPTPGINRARNTPPPLEYYRAARREFAALYQRYNLRPPGIPAGSHVSLCYDIYRNMDALAAESLAGGHQGHRMQLILVGGFLGAGKTTLLHHAARHLTRQGHTVGLITNDQAPDLVDTALLTPAAAGIREVAGSCFCCNFDGLMRAVDSLAQAGATHIIAEPVGSCTDLSATIMNPLKQLYPEIHLAPLTVLIDPQRLEDTLLQPDTLLDPDAVYILRLQLAEADHLLLTKTDTRTPEQVDAARAWLEKEFPHIPTGMLALEEAQEESAALAAWLDTVCSAASAGQNIVAVDYDRYAHGEAVLGWLNAAYDLRWIDELEPQWEEFVRRFLTEFHDQLREAAHEVGHVKLILQAASGQITANLTSLHHPYEVHVNAPAGVAGLTATLTFNARVQTSPQTLEAITQRALATAAHGRVAPTPRSLHSLQPGRPTPTHRYASVVK